MKLGCSSASYHAAFRAGRLEQRDWVRVCADHLDVDGIELVDVHFPTTDRGYLRDLKKQCVDLGLTIASVAVTNDFGPDDRRQQEIEKVRQWTDVAAYIGAPVVRVFAGSLVAQGLHVPEAEEGRIVGAFRKVFGQSQPNPRRAWSDAASALRQCADYAAERVIVLALQNSPHGVVASQADLAQCLRDVGSPWLRVCLSPADLPQAPDTSIANVVTLRAAVRDLRDDGSDTRIQWHDVLRRASVARFRGFVLLEYQGDGEPETAVLRATRHLRAAMQAASAPAGLPSAPPDANGAADPSTVEAGRAAAREIEDLR